MNETPTPPTTSATRTHHPYSPSKMNYLEECAAFEGRSTESEAAEQGTFLHDIMEQMLQMVIKGKAATTMEQISGWVKTNHELADEEVGYLTICARRVDKFLAKKPQHILTEIKVIVYNDDGTEFNSGYLDVLYIFGTHGVLQDYKFGWEPVRPAATNRQGQNYAVGIFQQWPQLLTLGVEFLQPKLSSNPVGYVYDRRQTFALRDQLQEIVERAKLAKSNPEAALPFVKTGTYCKYCARSATCSVRNNQRALVAAKYAALPMPESFKGIEIATSEQAALARYYIEILEDAAEEVKKRAKELAEANDGKISCTLPNGDVVSYEMHERNADRVLGSAPEIADALKDIVTPEEVLGAADLAIGKLETIAKNAMVENAKAAGQKLTKKAAWEQIQSLLESLGLLSRPDTRIRFLKLVKTQKLLS